MTITPVDPYPLNLPFAVNNTPEKEVERAIVFAKRTGIPQTVFWERMNTFVGFSYCATSDWENSGFRLALARNRGVYGVGKILDIDLK